MLVETARSGMDIIFQGVGCNNSSSCISIGKPSLGYSRIVFGTSSSIGIASFSTQSKEIIPSISHLLHGHEGRISSVHWGWNKDHDKNHILSGDALGQLFVHYEDLNGKTWDSQLLTTCNASISALTSIQTSSSVLFFAATSNGDIFVYEERNSNHIFKLSLGERHIIETLDATINSNGAILLAAAGVDMQVHFYKFVDNEIIHLTSLSGHKGWIRSLSFTVDSLTKDSILASASQDQKIRLWRVTPDLEVSFDAMLVGHEDWVTNVTWIHPNLLLSSSMDNRMILWQPDESKVWVPQTQIGDLGGLGLLSCVALAEDELVGLTFTGQLHRWILFDGRFIPVPGISGHTRSVTDLSWSLSGEYFISVSTDQTARAFANVGGKGVWREISRAQVHGYDINCGCFLDDNRFASGADEKIVRVFKVPEGMSALVRGEGSSEGFGFLPELSLTTTKIHPESNEAAINTKMFVGEQLNRSVWPEIQKLYGHGNELLCVASNHRRTLLASACKSRDEKFASVWLWDTATETNNITPTQQLTGHASSVVQLAFSHNDQFLVSVSKDRNCCVYELQNGLIDPLLHGITVVVDAKYALVVKQKAHKRIIWTCGWSPDDVLFATGSRDDSLLLWGRLESTSKWQPVSAPVTFPAAVTAVAFRKTTTSDEGYVIAVGLESGRLYLVTVSKSSDGGWSTTVDHNMQLHGSTISRIVWHPTDPVVATASASGSVVVLQV